MDTTFHRGNWSAEWSGPLANIFTLEKEYPIPFDYITSAYEKNFLGNVVSAFTRQNYWMAPAACALYFLMIWAVPKFMENRKPFDLKRELKYWNLFLAVYSFFGALHTAPHLFMLLNRFGYEFTICSPASSNYGHGSAGLWTALFIFSKYFELIDTLFILLRKKPLSFLHWYHHLTVLIYTWDAYCWEMSSGLYFIAMNYTVHAIMYFYYYLAAVSKPPSWGLLVTLLQLSQMVVGMGVTLSSLFYAFSYPSGDSFPITPAKWLAGEFNFDQVGCTVAKSNAFYGLIIYGSYFALFLEFFINRYVFKRRSRLMGGGKPSAKKMEKMEPAAESAESKEISTVRQRAAARERTA